MATDKTERANTNRTMSVQEAGRRGGHRVQELVHKGERLQNSRGISFGEKMPENGPRQTHRDHDNYDRAA